MRSRLDLQLPRVPASVSQARHRVGAFLATHGIGDERADRLGLIVSEACTNVVRHGGGRAESFRLRVEFLDEGIVVTVTDQGAGFQVTSVPAPGAGQLGGYGLYLINQLADEAEIRSLPGRGTRVTAKLLLRPDAAR